MSAIKLSLLLNMIQFVCIHLNQDQKILALMWAKKEEEERQKLLRELSHRQWEEEMKATLSSSRGSSFRRRKQTGDLSTLRRKDKLTVGINKYSAN